MTPHWLFILSIVSLGVAGISALIVALDELRNPQHMWVMNLVWPITALYGSLPALWLYFRFGRLSTHHAMMQAKQHHDQPPAMQKPDSAAYAIAATHCGAGCTLGDIIAEWSIFFFPAVLTWLGYHSLFNQKIFAAWILDFLLAFIIGVAFQYFTIVPMRKLPPGKGIVQAFKADTLSLTAWQLGMYGWMAIATFAIFGRELPKTGPLFWFMMQIAMLFGFCTSYPVNIWLVRTGIKERM